jgi:hypothetical protein
MVGGLESTDDLCVGITQSGKTPRGFVFLASFALRIVKYKN